MIAVVDDDMLVRNGIASLLRSSGLNTCTYESADAFLRRDPVTTIDLLISDYRMPGMTGVDLINKLRMVDDLVPVIIMTALVALDIAETASAAGALAFLRKPFARAVLLELVHRAVE